MNSLRILGTRGIPAAHGGFETFAERLALYLVHRGWSVTVYCQEEGAGAVFEDHWQGVRRVHVPVPGDGPRATVAFDWRATRHAAREPGLCLTLGYNTAVFCGWLRWAGLRNAINMDGIEWRRAKWSWAAKAWLRINEFAGCHLGNQLVADHPEIERHLLATARADKITMIPYGADRLQDKPSAPVQALGLEPGRYLTLIARAEPENSVLEVVQAFARRPRGLQLAVLGNLRQDNAYHRAVRAAAAAAPAEVRLLGAIYDPPVVQSLRVHSLAYVHGHQVGGTNPSLVEALGAGNAVIAHDNRFNRWVLGASARYFESANDLAGVFDGVLGDAAALAEMREGSLARFEHTFTWPVILAAYEAMLLRLAGRVEARPEG